MPRDPTKSPPGGGPAECEVCHTIIARRNDLARHMRIHNQITFKCEWANCTYENAQRTNVLTHMHTHTQNKLRACPDCSFTTSDPGSLTRHRKRFHGYEPIQSKSKKDADGGADGSGSGSTLVHSVLVPELTLPVDRDSFNSATMGGHSKCFQKKCTEAPSSTDESFNFKLYWDYLIPSSVLPSALAPALDNIPLSETMEDEFETPECLFPEEDSLVEAAPANLECSSVLASDDSGLQNWMSSDPSLLPQQDE